MSIEEKLSAYCNKMQRHFQTHSKTRECVGHSSKVHSVGWNCNGRHLASCSFDKTVSIYTLEKDRLVRESNMKGHSDSVDQLCWHPTNSSLLVTASGDRTIRIWDARGSSPKCTDIVSTKGENINICWSPNGNTIAVGNKEDLITFVDTRTYKIIAEEQFKFELISKLITNFQIETIEKTKCNEDCREINLKIEKRKDLNGPDLEESEEKVNEISWNNTNDLFFLTNGHGCINILRCDKSGASSGACLLISYPELKQIQSLNAHPANCICIKFDPTGKYFATGSADALVSLWDLNELCCVRCFSRLDWPVRTLSFSYDGQILASASEDLFIDIAMVETGEQLCEVSCSTPTFTVAWHPTEYLLAFACDDKDKHRDERDAGTVKLFGIPS